MAIDDVVSSPRRLTILHFNDVYNIEAATREPVGGAARFAHKVKSFHAENPLIIFSGDAFSPSLMSAMTFGKQMVPVLNKIGVHVAAVGNHDFDFGVDNLVGLASQCNFPWLMANVLDKETGKPLGIAQSTLMLTWQGVRVGLVGLVEKEWMDTLPTIEPECIEYIDFVEEGRRLSQQLRDEGAELVIAITHMRMPNDLLLARSVPGIDVVLGGHDHSVAHELVVHGEGDEQRANLVVKSGTDFRNLTHLVVELPAAPGARPIFTWALHNITADVPEDEEVAAAVAEYAEDMSARMDNPLGETVTALDGRFSSVRAMETNLGNLFACIMRTALKVDVVLLNSGCLRSDCIHPPGVLTFRDYFNILPMVDESVVLEVTGAQLLAALENGVSQVPRLEGRFLQVSGVRFKFDSTRAPGQRVLADSVEVNGAVLEPDRRYSLATKEYVASGKDGFDCLEGCKVLRSTDDTPSLPLLVRNHFRMLEVLSDLDSTLQVAPLALKWAAQVKGVRHHLPQHLQTACRQLSVRDLNSGKYAVGPIVDGRITDVAAAPPPHGAAAAQ